jgi:DNA-directed RNA polymerase specialized sigma24 family protein
VAFTDTKTIANLLGGNPKEQEEAIRLIDKQLRTVVVAKLRRTAPGLSPEEIVEAFQETLVGVWQMARSGWFDAKKPLVPLLLTIAQRKAIDGLRKREVNHVNYDEMFDAVDERLSRSRVGEAWRAVAANEDGRRIMIMIRGTAAVLPKRQHLVASAVMEFFPRIPSYEAIRDHIKQKTGEGLTTTAVKRAWQEARKKIREVLVREGYFKV